jgi:hypothetical protein
MEILAMPLPDTFRKAVISIYLQTFVLLLEFLSVGSILSDIALNFGTG